MTLTLIALEQPVVAASGTNLRFATLSGGEAPCGVTIDHQGYCWGRNTFGGLGDGTFVDKTAPTLVAGGHSWRSLHGGSLAKCGVTTSDVGYCWGWNMYGQVGDSATYTDKNSPTLVSGGYSWKVIRTGGRNTCGITTSNVTYCWGSGSNGEIGNGANSSTLNTPTLVSGGHTFTSIDVSNGIACGIEGTAVYCWGGSMSVGIGDGTGLQRNVPTLVSGGLSLASVTTVDNSACALTTTGTAYCWGWNLNGWMGDGSVTANLAPDPVSGGFTWTSLGSGGRTVCGIRDNAQAYCWGSGSNGQVGDGLASTSDRTTPTLVSTSAQFTSISGGFTSCALTSFGQPYCWGNSTYNQLLNGSVNSNAPVSLYFIDATSTVSVQLDPSFTFTVGQLAGNCNGVPQSVGAIVSATAVGQGHVAGGSSVMAAQELAVSSNAGSGFAVYLRSATPLTSGSHAIADVSGSNASPGSAPAAGTEGFGYTTSDAALIGGTANRFTNGGAKWAALSGTNAPVSSATGPTANADTVCVGYLTSTSNTTPAGTYNATVVYTAVPVF
jgi:alpha-tubulin suppressor-like RCC1 family protein